MVRMQVKFLSATGRSAPSKITLFKNNDFLTMRATFAVLKEIVAVEFCGSSSQLVITTLMSSKEI